jgi:pimeloyl-ACP methyl ester carboxylesterase
LQPAALDQRLVAFDQRGHGASELAVVARGVRPPS